ncbi:hypothetical protein ABPG74_020734 [Tetrahymena malaccensis]
MCLLDSPQECIESIPEDYIFRDQFSYYQIMNKLVVERFFKQIRDTLKKNSLKSEDRLQNEREVLTYEGLQRIQDYEVADIHFSENGLILQVNSSMKIQKYQKEQCEILNNQILIFVNKKSKQYFVGKTIHQNNKQQSKPQKLDESSLQNKSFQLLVENVRKNEKYKDITKDDIKELEDILKEDFNYYDIIDYRQSFEIKMNLKTEIKEFLVDINQISENYILLFPQQYWFTTKQILNCQQNFSKLQQIQFYDQTIRGQKGESTFPEYGFLNGRNDLKQEFMQQVEEQVQNIQVLDEYQLQALRYALHNQNVVIQGPSGTGKTYLASHLINTISNLKEKYCKKPILIISKNNCSLDQLLIQLIKIIPNIKLLRLGYQITLKEIEEYTVYKQKGPQRQQFYLEGYQQINEKLQNYKQRDTDQDYYQPKNSQSQSEENIDNQKYQNQLKKQEIESFDQEMIIYEQSNQKNYVIIDNKYQKDLANFMNQFQFIGMTLAGYHTYFEALKILGAEIVIIEEASEIMESQFFPILTPNLKHLIQFGDHQQVNPMVRSKSLERNFNNEISYFERLIKVNQINYVTLCQQKRMRPEFEKRLFYNNKYRDDPFVRYISNVNVYLFPHNQPDQAMNEDSQVNEFEAYMIKFLANRLSYKNSITILSEYKSQKTLIESKLQRLPYIKVFTVDEYQKNEDDIIILSCVSIKPESINFAFYRAKVGFFCIGNGEALRKKCQKLDEIFESFNYEGINQSPLYKKLQQLTYFQLEINWYRRSQQKNKQCRYCQEKFHKGVCKYGPQEIILFDHFKQKFMEFNQQNPQDNQILILDEKENQIDNNQESDISSIDHNQTTSSISIDEFISLQEQITLDQNKNQNNKKEINKKKQFLTEDEKENSFQSTKKQKQKISQKLRKQKKASQTQNTSTNLNNSQ